MGEEGRVIVGIVNRQHETMSYEVKITVGGRLVREIGPIELAHEGGWRHEVGFVPQQPGENQRVEFALYKIRTLGAENKPALTLHLWIDVDEGG
ncbi:MAG: hypothetical protein DDT24_00506 [Chloroflexi bacterium]|nr:hypothetical protein [Chloroflexota bacterium]